MPRDRWQYLRFGVQNAIPKRSQKAQDSCADSCLQTEVAAGSRGKCLAGDESGSGSPSREVSIPGHIQIQLCQKLREAVGGSLNPNARMMAPLTGMTLRF